MGTTQASPNREDNGSQGYRTFAEIQRHQRIYFLGGKDTSKIQFSFKIPIKENSGHYFGYSQKMIWALFSESSSPVRDVNFNPEYFYRQRLKNKYVHNIDYGIEHLSNGGKGLESRSWNTVFMSVPAMYEFEGQGKLYLTVKPFYIFDEEPENRDVQDYTGWYQVELCARDFLQHVLEYDELYVTARPGGQWGGEFTKGSFEVGMRFKVFSGNTAPHAFIQYFSGYGESQLRYAQRTHALRIGISI